MKLNALIVFVCTLFFFSCSKNEVNPDPLTPAPAPALAASNMTNVSYGSDAAQKMDFYLPEGRTTATTKVIIMVHGGSWIGGDKTDMTAFVPELQSRLSGYAIFNINYRLATLFGANGFPTQETDVKAAVDFIYSKRSEYNISDKFVMLGVSAGSHLALLQSYKYTTPKIKAVVDFFGPTDMADMYNNPASPSVPAAGIALLLGGAPPSALYTSSSPVNFVTASAPPTLILHGGVDNTVRVQQSTMLRDKLILNSVTQQYVFYPTEGHGWTGTNLTDSYNKVQAFLNLNVQ